MYIRNKHVPFSHERMNPMLSLQKKAYSIWRRRVVVLVFFSFFFCQLAISKELSRSDLYENCAQWMIDQIGKDLNNITTAPISQLELDDFFNKNAKNLYLLKVTIFGNRVYVDNFFLDHEGINYRLNPFIDALNLLCSISEMPNVVFLISMHDGLGTSQSVPIFVMSKKRDDKNLILIPDYDSLLEGFQVLNDRDVTEFLYPWSKKRRKLIWRGSTAQRALGDGGSNLLRRDNLHQFSRVTLCEFSAKYSGYIDAKFTFLAQMEEPIPYLDQFLGDWISYEKLFTYKYHLMVDGNVCAYSNSGWKFFTNSLVFKAESKWIQWYYDALIPYYHYVPVESNLNDLMEKIDWAKNNDRNAEIIAKNARDFAIQNLTVKNDLIYIYHLIQEYSKCHFIYN